MRNASISQIRTALADPDAPWYGSDLVPLVADLVERVELFDWLCARKAAYAYNSGESATVQVDGQVGPHFAPTLPEAIRNAMKAENG